MYYLQSRYYDPAICRFINADSYASTGQSIIGHNMYAYCDNNPVTRSDPTGGLWEIIFVAVCIAALTSGCSSETGSTEPYSGKANCYAYAMHLENDPRNNNKPFSERIHPGAFVEDPLQDYHFLMDPVTFSIHITDRVERDAEALGYSFRKVYSADATPAEGKWLIAIGYHYDPYDNGSDFHFWRKDADGTWSHKFGDGPIMYVDFSGNIIYDPSLSDKGKYDYFIGYFEVGP